MTTPKHPFTKPSTTYDQQIAILRQRGMRVNDEEVARFYLQHLNYYRSLRLLVLDAIERIEVSVRSQWAYHLAHQHGPHAHLDISLAANPARWHSDSLKLTKEVQRSDEVFIRHLKATYSESLPPVWAVCEVMSLGLIWVFQSTGKTCRFGIKP